MKEAINPILIAITIFQWALLWLAWTVDSVNFSKATEELTCKIEEVHHRCDSLEIANSVLSQIKSDTVIVNLPQPVVKIINRPVKNDVFSTSN